jgi:hypothetical protein
MWIETSSYILDLPSIREGLFQDFACGFRGSSFTNSTDLGFVAGKGFLHPNDSFRYLPTLL